MVPSPSGLIPSWAKDPTGSFKTINARSETVTTTPSFYEPFKSRRCLIPADGFYEWKKYGKTKQPDCFEGWRRRVICIRRTAGKVDRCPRASNRELRDLDSDSESAPIRNTQPGIFPC